MTLFSLPLWTPHYCSYFSVVISLFVISAAVSLCIATSPSLMQTGCTSPQSSSSKHTPRPFSLFICHLLKLLLPSTLWLADIKTKLINATVTGNDPCSAAGA